MVMGLARSVSLFSLLVGQMTIPWWKAEGASD
jgi:hypothetical protein